MGALSPNPQQLQAINSDSRSILALGVPGCGKTTVLVERIKMLLQQGASPWEFLVITFTKKAAANLKEKLAAFLDEKDLRKMSIGTSHAFCLRVIRQWAELIGYTPDLTIYDEVDQKDIVTAIIQDLGYSIKPKAAIELFDSYLLGKGEGQGEAYQVYKEYLARLKRFNALDYDLILSKAVYILQSFPEALQYYQNRYRFLFYDEFQDLAFLENDLMLTMSIENCFVVGDPDQNIYSFRGTEIKYILEFQERHPDCEVINLEYNYRSRSHICEAANNLIRNNKNRVSKKIISTKDSKSSVLIRVCDRESLAIADGVTRLLSQDFKPQDIAILTRTNRQLTPIREVLEDRGIPVQLVSRDLYWQRKEVKDILSFLRVIDNPRDDFSMGRILRLPYLDVSAMQRLRIKRDAVQNDASLFDACQSNHPALVALKEIATMVFENKHTAAIDVCMWVLEKGDYVLWLQKQSLASRIDSVLSLKDRIKDFDLRSPEDTSLRAFLEDISLLTAIDSWDEKKDAVSIMTMHCAKGLEWPVVIIAGCEEELTPLPCEDEKAMEEERRLFYVAMTRAADELICTWAKEREVWRKLLKRKPSRFLKEMKGE